MKRPFVDEPDGVSEMGVKLWLHESLTQWAEKPILRSNGEVGTPGLVGVQVMYAELPDGMRLLIAAKDGRVLYETQQTESMAVWLDCMKVSLNKD